MAAKKKPDDLFLLAYRPYGTNKAWKKKRCNPTVLKGFGNFGDQIFTAAEKNVTKWPQSNINRDEQGYTGKPHEALTRIKFFLLPYFLDYLLPLSNRRKRKKDHQSFPLPVLVVPLFFTFSWRFSTKKKPTFGGMRKKKATTRTLAEKSIFTNGNISEKLILVLQFLQLSRKVDIILIYIFGIPKLTSNWNRLFVWNAWMDKKSQGCFKIGRIFVSILHMIHPSMDDVRSQVLMGTVRASVGAVFNKGHRNQHLKYVAWQHLT